MIISINIKNLALIDSVSFEPKNGLNVLSGETGAGKSLLLGSLNFVLGNRLSKTLVRHGCDWAFVEVVFDSENSEVADFLQDLGIEKEDYIFVSRKLHSSGKSECRINGRMVNLAELKRLLPQLLDMYSQGEQLTLTEDSNHIKILDNSDEKVVEELARYQDIYQSYCGILKELEKLGDADARIREADILNYQLEEIKAAAISIQEEDSLLSQRKRLVNIKRIAEGVNNALVALNNEGLPAINQALYALQKVSEFDDLLGSLVERIDSASIEIGDIVDTLKREISYGDEKDLEKIQKRIEYIREIKRKYGGSFESVQDFVKKGEERLALLEGAQEYEQKLEVEKQQAHTKLLSSAAKLTDLRKKAAKKLTAGITSNLEDLQMKGTQFEVQIKQVKEGSLGVDEVLFMISPNLGQPLAPLSKIASGGEMSRFMLALKSIIAACEDIDTLVFDEIDAGISGSAAWTVAEKLYDIAKGRQVIAVTHLAQIVAMADNHYLIKKSIKTGDTITQVEQLDNYASLAEIMRLAGSSQDSQVGRLNAQEIKAQANLYKQKTFLQ